ncbi:exodeoxyribonuclease V subunit gamma, partial [Desulfosarcina sp. OttesenSCG-928-B08]|nr:exodeoxyribonuclease V subunit gamma [Desulfosarcina sp. OttesenSCG-928-B08]
MSIHLYFSNQLSPLAKRLHAHLTMDADSGPILSPPLVVVPTMNLSKWVKLFLARHSGIFMNVRFSYLEDGLWQMLRVLFPDLLKAARPIDPSRFRLILFFILMGQVSEPDMPEAIRRYLVRSKEEKAHEEGYGEEKTGADELRAWQLAGTLARLFQEYEYHRMDMIHRWRKTDDVSGDPVEDGQRWLYRKALDLSSAFGRISEAPCLTLAEYADLLPEKLPAPAPGHPFSSVHVFGLSQISPLHVHLLARLGEVFDFHVYSLNPSREYWEDIQTPGEKKWQIRNGAHTLSTNADEWEAGELFSETGHPLLSAWGKTGRESIRLLCELTGYDFYAGFDDPPKPDTVLAAVRYSLLTLSPAGDGISSLAQDTSLQIFAAPGIRREVETVYQSILYHLETDPDLAMTDIAVMVSDMARYKPMVDAVFGQRPAQIRYNLVDARAVAESAVARAILAFIPIAGGDFSRKAVFDLLHNPCVMKKWRYTPEDLGVWVNWADELGIFHDFENPETSMDRAGPQAGRYSWKQGLQRLRLSRIMTSPMDVLFGDPAPHFNGLVPFADIHTPDDALLETFCAVVTELFRQGSAFRMAGASAKTWKTLFFRMVDAFVEIPEDMPGEEAVYQSLVEAFSVFEDYDTLMAASPGRPLTQAAVWTFVRSHLDGISGGQGAYLTGGVTISAMIPMRPIPFKIVYVLGLEEGRFPARHPDSPLDL